MEGERDCFVGVDLGGTFVKTALVDSEGHVLSRHSLPTNASAGVKPVLEIIRQAVEAVRSPGVRGIGVATPGLVDSKKGDVHDLSNFQGWHHVRLTTELTERCHLPAFADNDGNVMALAECEWGAGKGSNSLLGITLGTGVGGGLVIDRKPYQTSGLSAVEIGHIVVIHNGLACACGSKGCLERYVGNRFIVERFLNRVDAGASSIAMDKVKGQRDHITPEILSQAADEGDALSLDIWKETGEIIGSALVTAIHLLAPEVIAIGGGVSKAGEKLFGPIKEWVARHSLSALGKDVRIVPAELGNDAGVIGAACLAMKCLPRS